VGYISIEIYSPPFFLVKKLSKNNFFQKNYTEIIPNHFTQIVYFFYIGKKYWSNDCNIWSIDCCNLLNISYNLCI